MKIGRKSQRFKDDFKSVVFIKKNLRCYGVLNMVSRKNLEQTANQIAGLDKTQLTSRIKNFKGRFKLDFNEDYLNQQPVDRLRHILLAAVITKNSHN